MSLLDSQEIIERYTELNFPITMQWLDEIGFFEIIPRCYVYRRGNITLHCSLYSITHHAWEIEVRIDNLLHHRAIVENRITILNMMIGKI